MHVTYKAVHNARPVTRTGARLVGMASVKTLITLRNVRHAKRQVVRPVLTKLPSSMTTWILASHAILLTSWWIPPARKSAPPSLTVLEPAGMKTKTFATQVKPVGYARSAPQILNVLRASPAKIMSVGVAPLNTSLNIPAALAGTGVATLCAGQIKSAASQPTISIDAMNATTKKTAAGGRTAKTSAITVLVYVKIHASPTRSCLLRAAIKKHLSFNAHAIPTTTLKDLSGEMATKSMVCAP